MAMAIQTRNTRLVCPINLLRSLPLPLCMSMFVYVKAVIQSLSVTSRLCNFVNKYYNIDIFYILHQNAGPRFWILWPTGHRPEAGCQTIQEIDESKLRLINPIQN